MLLSLKPEETEFTLVDLVICCEPFLEMVDLIGYSSIEDLH